MILETMPEKKDIRKVFYVASVNPDNTENLLMLVKKISRKISNISNREEKVIAMLKLMTYLFLVFML